MQHQRGYRFGVMCHSALPPEVALPTVLMFLMVVVAVTGGDQFCLYDCLVFTQQWPSSFCQSLYDKSECTIPTTINDWTIHGLWPQTTDRCKCWPLFPSDLQELQEELSQQWPSFLKFQNNFQFWNQEWMKHGSTAACEEGLNSPLRYFQTGLRLWDKFNLGRLLKKAGVTPSCEQSYKVKELHELLAPTFGETLEIQCVRDQQDRELWFQVKIYLSRVLTVGCRNHTWMDWEPNPDFTNVPHLCPTDGHLYLLPIDPRRPADPCGGR